MKSYCWCGLASLALVLPPTAGARADYIFGVTASTTMGSGFGTNLQNTVNGVGLVPGPSLTAFHNPTIPTNSWVSTAGTLTGQITFNLNGLYEVDSFSFWNQNAGGPGIAGSTGINRVEVLFSTDGTNFNSLPGGPSGFAQVPASGSFPEVFNFNPVTATHFRFNVLSNYGDAVQTGFAEVAFDSTAVIPEPASLVTLAAGVAGLAGYGWLRRKSIA